MLQIKQYSDNILKNINFELKNRQNLIILGSNGAGKSTLAKVLCGITPSKNVFFNNQQLDNIRNRQRTKLINYVPAKLEIFDEYIRLDEYLNLSRLYSLLESKNLLKLLELEKLKNKPCQQLSSGEQQLTMLATAILHNAKITIFDEPTANLDPQKSRDIYSILKSNILESKIIITHDLNLAYKLGYDILYIKEGKVVFKDSSEKFFNESNLNEYFGTSVKLTDDGVLSGI
ncbi:ABC-type transport systems, involved in lipoprotein release, ATPase components [hydrothermal vent metagenome]|uniref:ABC-type transport systems, involved in lipoprotein release, ATPase components n=1 Tax=hydrothermal vent metagenome TaxID=652676 RepID=A0A1W1D143_9ZZZZ